MDSEAASSRSATLVPRRQFLKGAFAGGALLATGTAIAGCGSVSPTSKTSGTTGTAVAPSTTPRRGGDLSIGMLGGSASDTLDANAEVTAIDTTRMYALYNGVVRLSRDASSVEPDLAEELTPNATATEWTIRLRPDVVFHNGKSVTASDVEYTFNRIRDPKKPLDGASSLQLLERMQILDSRTLRLHMSSPFSALPEFLSASQEFGIVPIGYDPKQPIGTGPFKYRSFTPGQRSVFTRNADYFRDGLPNVDEVTIVDFADSASAMNAVTSGVTDMFAGADPTLLQVAKSQGLTTFVETRGFWTPFTMRVDQAPFNDNRVRQAFRLIVDRPVLIKSALNGLGAVGNDVFAPNDPDYDTSLVRHQDLARAKSLLKQAGHEGLTVQLVTSNTAEGVVGMAQVFAEQAAGAGVTVHLSTVSVSTFFGPNYLQWTFSQDYWGTRLYLNQAAQSMLPGAVWDETHWDKSPYAPQYAGLYKQAQATLDPAKRRAYVQDMQRLDFDYGGYIIPAYDKLLNILSRKVHGITPNAMNALAPQDLENVWIG